MFLFKGCLSARREENATRARVLEALADVKSVDPAPKCDTYKLDGTLNEAVSSPLMASAWDMPRNQKGVGGSKVPTHHHHACLLITI
jgi:hypothetical protein